MSSLKDEIKELYKSMGGRAKALKQVQRWFDSGMAQLKSKDTTLDTERKPFKPGMIYVFKYEKPKHMEKLPWWDKNPVVLALNPTDQKNDIGINLNLLPSNIRIELLDAIYTQMKPFIELQKKGKTAYKAKLQGPLPNFTYESTKKFLEKFGYDFAIRQYVPNLKNNQRVVAYEKWSYVAICSLINVESNDSSIVINENILKKMFDEHNKNKIKKRSEK